MNDALALRCAGCSAALSIDPGFAGLTIRCLACRQFLAVPGRARSRSGPAAGGVRSRPHEPVAASAASGRETSFPLVARVARVRDWLRSAAPQATALIDERGRPRTAPPTERRLVNSLGMRMIYLRPGEFLMGSPSSEPDRRADEPEHAVEITAGFYLAAGPVTQAQYWSLMRDRPSRFRGDDPPVESVTWRDAVEFCRRLTRLESTWRARLFPGSPGLRRYRLPTEAEWEYAARAGRRRAFATGSTLGGHEANCDGGRVFAGDAASRFRGRTTEVGAFRPNAWGLYDLHGNVAEWVHDRYAAYPYGPCVDPRGPKEGVFRVTRGGSWCSPPAECRCAARERRLPDQAHETVGFRVALEVRA